MQFQNSFKSETHFISYLNLTFGVTLCLFDTTPVDSHNVASCALNAKPKNDGSQIKKLRENCQLECR